MHQRMLCVGIVIIQTCLRIWIESPLLAQGQLVLGLALGTAILVFTLLDQGMVLLPVLVLDLQAGVTTGSCIHALQTRECMLQAQEAKQRARATLVSQGSAVGIQLGSSSQRVFNYSLQQTGLA
jgi:hypothetical protein